MKNAYFITSKLTVRHRQSLLASTVLFALHRLRWHTGTNYQSTNIVLYQVKKKSHEIPYSILQKFFPVQTFSPGFPRKTCQESEIIANEIRTFVIRILLEVSNL